MEGSGGDGRLIASATFSIRETALWGSPRNFEGRGGEVGRRPPITASRGAPPSRISGINSTLCDIQIGAPWNFFALTSSPQPPFSSQPRSIIHALRLPFFAPFLFSFFFFHASNRLFDRSRRKERYFPPRRSFCISTRAKSRSKSRFPKNRRVILPSPLLPCLIGPRIEPAPREADTVGPQRRAPPAAAPLCSWPFHFSSTADN